MGEVRCVSTRSCLELIAVRGCEVRSLIFLERYDAALVAISRGTWRFVRRQKLLLNRNPNSVLYLRYYVFTYRATEFSLSLSLSLSLSRARCRFSCVDHRSRQPVRAGERKRTVNARRSTTGETLAVIHRQEGVIQRH